MKDLDPPTTVPAHFGGELRRRRMAAGLSQEQLGKQCLASASLVRMIEMTQRVPKRDFAQRADDALGTGGTFGDLLRLVGQEGHPTWFRPFAEHEAEASTLRVFEPLAVPGLLQTEDYARALTA